MTLKDISIYKQRINCGIDLLAGEIQRIASLVAENPIIKFRVKNLETLEKKMQLKKTLRIFLIDDVYGIRILVKSVDEAYAVLEKISREFPGFLDHDYIKEPKIRPDEPGLIGKKLRLIQFIAYKNGVPFEIQITTAAFHKMNESLHANYHRRKYNSR